MKLTRRKQDVIKAIQMLTKRFGFPPTVRELGNMVGISCSTMHRHLMDLGNEGFISWEPSMPRTI